MLTNSSSIKLTFLRDVIFHLQRETPSSTLLLEKCTKNISFAFLLFFCSLTVVYFLSLSLFVKLTSRTCCCCCRRLEFLRALLLCWDYFFSLLPQPSAAHDYNNYYYNSSQRATIASPAAATVTSNSISLSRSLRLQISTLAQISPLVFFPSLIFFRSLPQLSGELLQQEKAEEKGFFIRSSLTNCARTEEEHWHSQLVVLSVCLSVWETLCSHISSLANCRMRWRMEVRACLLACLLGALLLPRLPLKLLAERTRLCCGCQLRIKKSFWHLFSVSLFFPPSLPIRALSLCFFSVVAELMESSFIYIYIFLWSFTILPGEVELTSSIFNLIYNTTLSWPRNFFSLLLQSWCNFHDFLSLFVNKRGKK